MHNDAVEMEGDRGGHVKVCQSAFDPRDKRRLGLWEPACKQADKGRIVNQRLRQILDSGGEGPGRHSQRERGKAIDRGERRHHGGDTHGRGVAGRNLAAVDVWR